MSELYHYGVKGMKWGVRKKKPTGTDGRSNGDKQRRKDIAKKVAIGAAVTAALVGGTYAAVKYKDYINTESARLAVARGKALVDHHIATTPARPGMSGLHERTTQAHTNAAAYVSRMSTAPFREKANLVKDYRKVVKNGLRDDLDRRWLYYVDGVARTLVK